MLLLLMAMFCFLFGGMIWLVFKLSVPVAIIGCVLFAIVIMYRAAFKMKEKEREDRGW